MLETPLISIIVPVYKVEEYLKRCVDSLIKQTYSNLEIILVDDGSPDKCGVLCDQYALGDDRVRVIHKENGGLSDARNVALDVFKGEYVAFVDSDDYVSVNYISNLFKAINEAKTMMSISLYKNVFEQQGMDKSCHDINIKIYDRICCLKKMFYQDGIETTAWGKLYHKSLFEGIRYPIGRLYEDIPVTYRLINKCEKIAVIDNIDYFYVQRKESIQYQYFSKKKMDAVFNMQEVCNFIKINYPELTMAVYCRYFSTLSNIIFQIPLGKYIEERQYIWNEMKKVRSAVIFNGEARKKARIGACVSIFGYRFMYFVYKYTQWRAR